MNYKDTNNMHRIYVSGALTGIESSLEIKSFYEAVALLCEEVGFNAYVPHLVTDPIRHSSVTPKSVFETDKRQVIQADLIIAYVGLPSLGVGMELAYAETNNIPIILLYEQDKNISRFPRGIPTVIAEIQFKDYSDALIKLSAALNRFEPPKFNPIKI